MSAEKLRALLASLPLPMNTWWDSALSTTQRRAVLEGLNALPALLDVAEAAERVADWVDLSHADYRDKWGDWPSTMRYRDLLREALARLDAE